MTERHAIVVGAGIGGLACALALLRLGWHVEVLEQAGEISEIGAGIQISPNGMRVLDDLGVTPVLEASLFEPEAIELRMSGSNRRIFRLPMKSVAIERWGGRYIQIHRADLQAALHRAVSATGGVVRTASRVTGYVREKDGASVYLDRDERQFAHLVVGADGIHSAIRAQLCGADRARFTGNVAWRITVPIAALGDQAPPPIGCIWAGEGKHAVTTRIKGGDVANFVGIVEQSDWQEEGWRIKGSTAQALADFGDWDPVLRRMIEASSDLHRWALFDRAPLARWHDGPVVLLGDAAHPMVPSMAQGAVQALEDAAVLARSLEAHGDVSMAAESYVNLRKPRVTAIQKRSLSNLNLFHKRGRLAQIAHYAPIWAAGKISPNLIHRQQDWIYGYDATKAFRDAM